MLPRFCLMLNIGRSDRRLPPSYFYRHALEYVQSDRAKCEPSLFSSPLGKYLNIVDKKEGPPLVDTSFVSRDRPRQFKIKPGHVTLFLSLVKAVNMMLNSEISKPTLRAAFVREGISRLLREPVCSMHTRQVKRVWMENDIS